jgi:hypothetical protein
MDNMPATRKITRDTLYTLEHYARVRPEYRATVMAHKRDRVVPIGPHATLYFEDALTMHYQVQEMLRAERIFEPQAIDEEIAAYNPLIPDGANWKATFMIEYADAGERALALAKMVGIEDRVWTRVGDFEKVYAIADEDLERATGEKTSSVHFLRFELAPAMVAAAKGGAAIAFGIEHAAYSASADPVSDTVRASLANDLL